VQILQTLRDEHEIIVQALDLLDARAQRLAANEAVPIGELDALLRFLRRYADACHHAKEEKVLFPALERQGMLHDGGPIGVMLHEHGVGREHVTAMASAMEEIETSATARIRFARAATELSTLLRMHIHKENNVLYMLAQRMLPARRDDELAAAAERHEADAMAPGEKDELLAALRSLAG